MVEASSRARVVTASRSQYANSNVRFLQWVSVNEPTVLNREWLKLVFEDVGKVLPRDGGVLSNKFKKAMKKRLVGYDKACAPLVFASPKLVPELFLQWIHTLGTGYDSVNTHRSAIRSLFVDHEQPFDTTPWADDIGRVFKGIQKEKARERQEGKVAKEKGKRAMPMEIFSSMAKRMWTSQSSAKSSRGKGKKEFRASFAILYMILSWNLMSRSKNIGAIQLSHLSWSNDALSVMFCVMKTNHTGRNMHPRHVYANPLMPHICPILALGVYLVTNDFGRGASPLFPGSSQYDRFTSTMKDLHDEFKKTFDCLRLYGTHSFRKGAATYCSSGSTSCPSHSAICLRCGWKQPGVQDTYLVYAAAGDQFVGRTVCGLPVNAPEFAIIAPHFVNEGEALIERAIQTCFVSLDALDNRVKMFCLASVVYHRKWLRDNLPKGHELFRSALFVSNGLLEKLALHVVCGLAEAGDTITASGIPPHISHLGSLARVGSQIEQMSNSLNAQMTSFVQHVDSACEKVTQDVLRGLDERQIESHVTPTMHVKDVFQSTGFEEMLAEMRKNLQSLSSSDLPRMRPGNAAGGEMVPDTELQTFSWGGKVNRLLPESFRFPKKAQVREMWLLYMCGNAAEGIRPVRDVGFDHFCDLQTRKRASEFFKLMRVIEDYLREKEQFEDTSDVDAAMKMFDLGKESLNIPSKTEKSRSRRVWQLGWRRASVIVQSQRKKKEARQKRARHSDSEENEPIPPKDKEEMESDEEVESMDVSDDDKCKQGDDNDDEDDVDNAKGDDNDNIEEKGLSEHDEMEEVSHVRSQPHRKKKIIGVPLPSRKRVRN